MASRSAGVLGGFLVLGLLALGGAAPSAAEEPVEAGVPVAEIDAALAGVGLSRRDLGWTAKGWWTGYPADIPYKLRHFDALLAEPLATIPYLRGMGASVRLLLDPARRGEKGTRGQRPLSRAVHALGIDRRFGAFRPYSANLTAEATPLDQALLSLWRHARRPTRYVTFGEESPYPLLEKDLAASVAWLPPAVSGVLGRLVLDLLDAERWADLAWRNVPLELRVAVSRRLDLGAEEMDALDYEPAFDDLMRLWDEASLWYAAVKAVEALDLAEEGLRAAVAADPAAVGGSRLDVQTPLGRVVVVGTGAEEVDLGQEGAWLAVDLGGNTKWRGAAGSSTAIRSLGVLLDLGGDDEYDGGDRTQGCGLAGVGVLLDAGGNDTYLARGTLSQGAGQCGLGALIDLGGDDQYHAGTSAQGCAYFGVGCLFDLAGRDEYGLHADGQGFGGVAGVGTLADRSGDDVYLATVEAEGSGRPSYHSDRKISVSNAQGCAVGRRGDGADGHSGAGGLGSLLDAEGNDRYTAGNWAQGCGYWFGTGFVWDGAGDDQFVANGWASASGAHFCIGAVLDEGGDDLHSVQQNWGPAFGHDFTLAVLADLGGNDRYLAGDGGIAHSINRSVVLLLDTGGDDAYRFGKPDRVPGSAPFDAKYLDRTGASRYWTEPTSVALFLDVGGTDAYDGADRNGTAWSDPAESENRRARNFAVGVDR